MVFSSLLFVYLFLPLNLLLYRFMPTVKAKNTVMLIFSLIFYAWGEPVYILLLVGMAVIDWLLSLYIEKQPLRSGKAKLGLVGMCFANLGLLAVFKYGTFILKNVQFFSGFPKQIPNILLPIGISFYTFQLISYVVDVYRGEVPAQKKFATLLLYVSMFHQCIAGPIVRYSDVCAELNERHASATDIADGIRRFTVGLAKKAVLANACAVVADSLWTPSGAENLTDVIGGRSVLALWFGVLAYTLQIYLDFSAYSDMAIGMGRMIGIHYRENFDYPYLSGSVSEFWRRWHISLGAFFRDYVYIPLGGNRKGMARTIFNLLIVWALTGLWHGASWNFVLWGLYYFIFIAFERLFLGKILKKSKTAGHIYLPLVVFFGWILFYFKDMNAIVKTLAGLFGLNRNRFCDLETLAVLGSYALVLILSLLAVTPIVRNLCRRLREASYENRAAQIAYAVGQVVVPVVLLLLSTAALVGNSYNPFLYFQF